jgi:hypothetical protein
VGLFLRLVNGVQRSFNESSTLPIYDQQLTIVSGAPANSNQMTGPVTAGTSVTLPVSGSYSAAELQVELNGQGIEPVSDYVYVGSGSAKTQVQFTFALVVGDVVDFRIIRAP